MFNTAIGPAISEWKTKHAEVIGVSVANINTRWKLIVNDQFRRDMDAHCATRSIFLRPDCYAVANLYHAIVNLAA